MPVASGAVGLGKSMGGYWAMTHIKRISRPAIAASMCDNISSDFQARLCFVLEFLTGFIFPIIESTFQGKYPSTAE